MRLQKLIETMRAYVYPGTAGSGVDVRQYFVPGVSTAGALVAQTYLARTQSLSRVTLVSKDLSGLADSGVTTFQIFVGSNSVSVSLELDSEGFVTYALNPTEVGLMTGAEGSPVTVHCTDSTAGFGNITVELTFK
jgi:hypothetical protein